MNFQECVFQCGADVQVIEAFNRLHDVGLSENLLQRLRSPAGTPGSLDGLSEAEQIQLAHFILFVHRQIWRKLTFARWRVGRWPATAVSRAGMPTTEASALDELMQRTIAV